MIRWRLRPPGGRCEAIQPKVIWMASWRAASERSLRTRSRRPIMGLIGWVQTWSRKSSGVVSSALTQASIPEAETERQPPVCLGHRLRPMTTHGLNQKRSGSQNDNVPSLLPPGGGSGCRASAVGPVRLGRGRASTAPPRASSPVPRSRLSRSPRLAPRGVNTRAADQTRADFPSLSGVRRVPRLDGFRRARVYNQAGNNHHGELLDVLNG
jgi:hypothetical protein